MSVSGGGLDEAGARRTDEHDVFSHEVDRYRPALRQMRARLRFGPCRISITPGMPQ
jgi:hypothetical protein